MHTSATSRDLFVQKLSETVPFASRPDQSRFEYKITSFKKPASGSRCTMELFCFGFDRSMDIPSVILWPFHHFLMTFLPQKPLLTSSQHSRGYCGLAPGKSGTMIYLCELFFFFYYIQITASKWQPWLFQESKGDGGFEGFAWTIFAKKSA